MTQYDLYEFATQFDTAFFLIGAAILLIELAEAMFKRALIGKTLWEMVVSASTQIPSLLIETTILTGGYALFYYIAFFLLWQIPTNLWTIALIVLLETGVDSDDEQIQRGVKWIKENQRESGRWWTRSLNTDRQHYITYSGTAYPLLALQLAGALPRQK